MAEVEGSLSITVALELPEGKRCFDDAGVAWVITDSVVVDAPAPLSMTGRNRW